MKNTRKNTLENTGGGSTHSGNCECFECTGNDPYLKKLRSNYGKNSAFTVDSLERFAARASVYGGKMTLNNADPIVPISVSKPAQTVVQTKDNSNLWSTLGNLGLDALGTIMQKQRDGEALPKALDQIATAGNKVVDSASSAAVAKGESVVGQNVIKFSPWIIGGIVLALGTIIFLVARK